MGVAAVESVLQMGPSDEPLMIGMIGNNVVRSPLMQCVENVWSGVISKFNLLTDTRCRKSN